MGEIIQKIDDDRMKVVKDHEKQFEANQKTLNETYNLVKEINLDNLGREQDPNIKSPFKCAKYRSVNADDCNISSSTEAHKMPDCTSDEQLRWTGSKWECVGIFEIVTEAVSCSVDQWTQPLNGGVACIDYIYSWLLEANWSGCVKNAGSPSYGTIYGARTKDYECTKRKTLSSTPVPESTSSKCPGTQPPSVVASCSYFVGCPTGYNLSGNSCVPIKCPAGTKLIVNSCISFSCPSGQRVSGNSCVSFSCPSGQRVSGNSCVSFSCPSGQRVSGNSCVSFSCPSGQRVSGNSCVSFSCPSGQQMSGNSCVAITCSTGYQLVGNSCVSISCGVGKKLVGSTCQAITCSTGYKLSGSTCVAITCSTGYKLSGNSCVAITCSTGYKLVGNSCQAITCSTGYKLVGNSCQAITCSTGYNLVGNSCQAITCSTGYNLVGNSCQAITCPTNQLYSTSSGRCYCSRSNYKGSYSMKSGVCKLECYSHFDLINGSCVRQVGGK
ncbi:MAG: hypothetical protein GY804_06965 [Alphaproteobacteria bacterium]|nr:hypothetical protein [Alphaproteobacteria bacterium]